MAGDAAESELPLEIPCAEVKRRLDADDFVLMDCRETDEHAHVCIVGARLVPMSEIPNRLPELEELRNSHIVVHCHKGGRSMQVTQWLRQQGFSRVQSMAGGIDAWAVDIEPGMPRY